MTDVDEEFDHTILVHPTVNAGRMDHFHEHNHTQSSMGSMRTIASPHTHTHASSLLVMAVVAVIRSGASVCGSDIEGDEMNVKEHVLSLSLVVLMSPSLSSPLPYSLLPKRTSPSMLFGLQMA